MFKNTKASLTLQDETEKYNRVWADPEYRVKCHGLDLYQNHRDQFPAQFDTAIDLGCGTGRLVHAWRGEGVKGYGVDLVEAAVDQAIKDELQTEDDPAFVFGPLWDLATVLNGSQIGGRLDMFEVGVCADVMEHIPPHMVERVLVEIASACEFVAFKICSAESTRHGLTLHLTRRDRDWWRIELENHFSEIEAFRIPEKPEDFIFFAGV